MVFTIVRTLVLLPDCEYSLISERLQAGRSSMGKQKRYIFSSAILCLLLIYLLMAGCYKDYSYERRPVAPINNSNTRQPPLSSCAACNSTSTADSSWQLTINGVVYCGSIVKPVVMPERTAFTFFGPSSCSSDSGFVASVFLHSDMLSGDKAGIKARMSCYYYDKVTPSHVYISSSAEPLDVTINSYVHQTGVMNGHFRGTVFDTAGRRIAVVNGQFRLRL